MTEVLSFLSARHAEGLVIPSEVEESLNIMSDKGRDSRLRSI
jgi:hypothetical protein